MEISEAEVVAGGEAGATIAGTVAETEMTLEIGEMVRLFETIAAVSARETGEKETTSEAGVLHHRAGAGLLPEEIFGTETAL